MSESPTKRLMPPDIRARKGGEPIVSLALYTAPMARLAAPYCDFLLVGDSVGMVLYGMDSTLGVTLDMMIQHGKAVKRGAPDACVVVDLPFGSYEGSPEQAYASASRVMAETGAQGVKLEGGAVMAPTIAFLSKRGIPVMAHVGLLPQSVNTAGGFRAHGRDLQEASQIHEDALAVADAGAFAMVVEGVVEDLARRITKEAPIPTIGIGASPACDGQVLVCDDAIGMFSNFKPRFVKRFAELAPTVQQAIEAYSNEVRARSFPAMEHCFGVKKSG
ncbi:3-methyl-2-oxobutanoate hydroxymethyltransferase [Rhodospirillaceae bacterium LM-1]|nr:3-methyl-2-oxobutanoate hydroxymethyltransferase [Rhodospirillaceae bacterium LM-1]